MVKEGTWLAHTPPALKIVNKFLTIYFERGYGFIDPYFQKTF